MGYELSGGDGLCLFLHLSTHAYLGRLHTRLLKPLQLPPMSLR